MPPWCPGQLRAGGGPLVKCWSSWNQAGCPFLPQLPVSRKPWRWVKGGHTLAGEGGFSRSHLLTLEFPLLSPSTARPGMSPASPSYYASGPLRPPSPPLPPAAPPPWPGILRKCKSHTCSPAQLSCFLRLPVGHSRKTAREARAAWPVPPCCRTSPLPSQSCLGHGAHQASAGSGSLAQRLAQAAPQSSPGCLLPALGTQQAPPHVPTRVTLMACCCASLDVWALSPALDREPLRASRPALPRPVLWLSAQQRHPGPPG